MFWVNWKLNLSTRVIFPCHLLLFLNLQVAVVAKECICTIISSMAVIRYIQYCCFCSLILGNNITPRLVTSWLPPYVMGKDCTAMEKRLSCSSSLPTPHKQSHLCQTSPYTLTPPRGGIYRPVKRIGGSSFFPAVGDG